MKAKIISVTLFALTTHLLSAQNISVIEKQLNSAFQRIDYWSSEGRDHKDAYDSLASANTKFENLLVRYTSSHPATLHHDFKSLEKTGFITATSEDGKFRVYSWDTQTGGTMHFLRMFTSTKLLIKKYILKLWRARAKEIRGAIIIRSMILFQKTKILPCPK